MLLKLTTTFQDEDGCPDTLSYVESTIYDSDNDGILDNIDSCLTLPETYNNFEDEDGCPDFISQTDSDNDGIVDAFDDCKYATRNLQQL